jgi:hypothetical protein
MEVNDNSSFQITKESWLFQTEKTLEVVCIMHMELFLEILHGDYDFLVNDWSVLKFCYRMKLYKKLGLILKKYGISKKEFKEKLISS